MRANVRADWLRVNCAAVLTPLVLAVLLTIAEAPFGARLVESQDKGRILAILTEKDVFRRGETVRVRVEVQNLQRTQRHQLVILNILDASEKAVYDSNLVKQNIDFLIGPNERKTVGPFSFTVPANLLKGKYVLLVGYREYPWEPLLEFKGASWCPPIRTVTIE